MVVSHIIEQANSLLARGDAKAAVALITNAADRGDGDALYQWALWHVYGEPLPRDFSAARILFGRAGTAGHAQGALTHAVFVALGAGVKPDWQDAISLLDRAAESDGIALQQRTLIAKMALKASGAPVAVPPLDVISLSPKLGMVRGLLTHEECDHLINLSRSLLMPSVVVDPVTHRQSPHPIRTSDGTVLGPLQQDLVVEAINRRIAAVTGTNVEQGEPLAVLRYTLGQQYRLHHDCLPGEANQRVITAIVYLNDGYQGGSTRFPEIGYDLRGEKGDAIFFSNTLADGAVDERCRHAGLPVMHGQKWICTRWIRARDFDPWGMRLT
jgi:prolyl 4-hydroxylase